MVMDNIKYINFIYAEFHAIIQKKEMLTISLGTEHHTEVSNMERKIYG